MFQSRETIFGALLSQLATLKTGQSGAFKTVSRRVRLWTDIPSDERPALIQIEPRENVVQTATGQPQEQTLYVNLLIVVDVQEARTSDAHPPISLLNPFIDAVESALAPDAVTWKQTLGGVVNHAWIEGEILKNSGDDDGTAIALLSVRMLVPS